VAHWSTSKYYRQHYNALRALSQIDLYVGDGQAARARLEAQWPSLTRSLLLRIQVLRLEAYSFWVRSALLVAARGARGDREWMLGEAERWARRIERERTQWVAPFVPLARAAMADQRGRREEAVALVESAAAGFEAADMGLHAAAARRRLGQLVGGDRGEGLVKAADLWMMDQRIGNPAAMTRLFAPGFVVDGEA
jgi:eukaryotic-like serine/threonine-protein kinase